MKRIRVRLCLIIGMMIGISIVGVAQQVEYVVLASKAVRIDFTWKKVTDKLVEDHGAVVIDYQNLPSEALLRLRELSPRYVAIVEKPENISLDFVVDVNQMSRKVDDDFYNDFLWGIITGYDAEAALRLVERAREPKLIGSAWCVGDHDFSDGRYFERMGRVEDKRTEWRWGEKENTADSVVYHVFKKDSPREIVDKMLSWAVACNPDLIVYDFPDAGNRMWLPRTSNAGDVGKVVPRGGKLWHEDGELNLGDNSRVCIASAWGGNTFGVKESVPISLLDGGNVTALLGGMTIFGNGKGVWGTLKYWLTDAERFTLAEAFFLNQQEMLYKLNQWSPELLKVMPYGDASSSEVVSDFIQLNKVYEDSIARWTGKSLYYGNKFGYMHEKDIVVLYGDPAWNVRVKDLAKDKSYTVESKMKGKKCVVTITTSKDFTLERVGGELRREGISGEYMELGNLPICYFFPTRLKNPRVSSKMTTEYEIEVNKDCLFIYNSVLEPDKKYKIVIDVDR